MGSDFSDFLAQLPFGLILTVCGSAILLVIVMTYIVSARARRAKARVPQTPAYVGAPSRANLPQTGDLPDLDMLMDMSSIAAFPPPPEATTPPRPTRKGTHTIHTDDSGEAEAVEVMAIMRDIVDGKLIVQMGDKLYKNIYTDADFKEKFTKLMRELAQTAQAKPVAPSAEPAPAPTPSPTPPMLMEDTPPEPPARKVESLPPPPIAPDGTMPGDLPSFKIEDQQPIQPRKRGQKLDIQPAPELDIAGAIEAYLQHKLKHTTDYTGRSIHVYPSSDGGVRIEVDGQYYDGVGDIRDDTVRAFMQQTIQEWQDRQ